MRLSSDELFVLDSRLGNSSLQCVRDWSGILCERMLEKRFGNEIRERGRFSCETEIKRAKI